MNAGRLAHYRRRDRSIPNTAERASYWLAPVSVPVAARGIRSRPLTRAKPAALKPLPINETRGHVGCPRTPTTAQKEGAT